MCLIILAPRGVEKNSEFLQNAIKTAAVTNDDGIGIMYKYYDNLFIEKGFITAEAVLSRLNELNLPDDSILGVHLRVGNRGAVNEKMCHPFVCSNNTETLDSTAGEFNLPMLMHNGTFQKLTLISGESDTYTFVKKFLSNEHVNKLFHDDSNLFKEIFSSVITTSRMLMFYPGTDRDFQKAGTWVEEQGLSFSNESYKDSKIKDIGGVTQTTRYLDAGTLFDRARNNRNKTLNEAFIENKNTPKVADYERKTRRDIFYEVLFSDKTSKAKFKYFTDSIGWEYVSFMGVSCNCVSKERYITDIVNLEYDINLFNYYLFNLEAKVNMPEYLIEDMHLYKIEKMTTINITKQQFVILKRVAGDSDTEYKLPLSEIKSNFFVKPKKANVYSKFVEAYLDLAHSMNSSNQKLKQLRSLVKGKAPSDMVHIPKYGVVPVLCVRWFIYAVKIGQNKPLLSVINFIN